MRTSFVQFSLVGLVALMSLSGCVYGNVKQVLRTQIAAETGCDSVKVSKRQEYAGATASEYEALACGEKRRYDCPTDDGLYEYGGSICTLSSTRRAGAPGMPDGKVHMVDGAEPEDEDEEDMDAPADDDGASMDEEVEEAGQEYEEDEEELDEEVEEADEELDE